MALDCYLCFSYINTQNLAVYFFFNLCNDKNCTMLSIHFIVQQSYYVSLCPFYLECLPRTKRKKLIFYYFFTELWS